MVRTHPLIFKEGMLQKLEPVRSTLLIRRFLDGKSLITDNTDPSKVLRKTLSMKWMFLYCSTPVGYGVKAECLTRRIYSHVAMNTYEALLVVPSICRTTRNVYMSGMRVYRIMAGETCVHRSSRACRSRRSSSGFGFGSISRLIEAAKQRRHVEIRSLYGVYCE